MNEEEKEELRKRIHKVLFPVMAKRIAWRQILRWVEAQMALVDTRMAKAIEVFMPYIQTNLEGQTLYERIEQQGFKNIGFDGQNR